MPSAVGAPSGWVLRADEICAGYGGTWVLNSASVRLHDRQVALIAGANGAGKSTLLKAIVGTIPSTSGRVELLGVETTGWTTAALARRGLGYVPQQDDVFANLTVRENLLLGGYLFSGKKRAARIEEVFAMFPVLGSFHRRLGKTLSGGERKILALARVLMLEPAVIVLDEPTASLSPRAAGELLEDHIGPLVETGHSVLMVEQRVKGALKIAHWAYVLASGRVVLSEPSAQFAERANAGRWLMGITSSTPGAERE
jgi:ABC-type branched-subunit amino acid transport system ATPase component